MKLTLTTLILVCTLAALADDRRILMTDIPLEHAEHGRVVVKDVQLLKHYEALKHFARGRILEQSERIPEALQAYHLANQFDGQAIDLLRHIIPLCFKMEQTASALKLLRRSLNIDPKQPDLWMRYAQELLDLQRYQEALAAVKEAHQKNDYSAYPAFAADLAIVKASCLEAENKHSDAEIAYRDALRIVQDRNYYLEDAFSPTAEELPAEEAKLLERLARVQVKAGRFDEAINHFKQAHSLRPLEKNRLDLNVAEVHLAANQYDKALLLLNKVTAAHPPSDEAYRLLLTALKQSGRASEQVAIMQKLHFDAPQHTAINLVLAEVLTEAEQYGQAEVLYREILTIDQAPFKEAVLGYFRLLIAQGKSNDVLSELDQIMTQPARARWSRAAMMALLSDGDMLRKLMGQPIITNAQPITRLMLIKLALQLNFWNDAERLTRIHLLSDLKPQETYLLLSRSLLEQYKFADLVTVCQAAIDHPAIQQPLIFYIELAKAHARQKQAQPALATLAAARELCAPGTTDEHKLLCTELYILHLLKHHQECIAKAKELLGTSIMQGPWARQVRYVLAHAYEAVAHFPSALEQYDAILRNDPNDNEAMAAHARCLLFQNADLGLAEKVIRAAIELDLIEQHKKRRFSPVALKLESKADYQATLATILLRTGRSDAGIQIMKELAARKLKPEPWVLLALGDAFLVQHQNEAARTTWQQALQLLPMAGALGTDLTNSLTARLQAVDGKVVPAGATSASPRQP